MAVSIASERQGYRFLNREAPVARRVGRELGPRLRLVLFFFLTWLGVAALLAFLLNEGHSEAQRKAQSDAAAVSALLEARLSATIRRLQGDLEYFVNSLPREAYRSGVVGRYSDSLSSDLALHAGHFPEVAGYGVVDASGGFVHVSSPEIRNIGGGDASYLRPLLSASERAFTFSDVLPGGRSGGAYQVVAITVRDGQGEVQGGVVAVIDLAYLAKVFDSTDVGVNGIISLRRIDDSRLILRRPARPELVNQPATNNPLHGRLAAGERQGAVGFKATIDGVDRIYAFQRIEGSPLYVTTGLATADYMAGWRQMMGMAGISAALLFLSLSLVLIRLMRAEGEEQATGAKLAESEARYRMLADNSHDVIWTLDIASRRYTYVSPSISALCGYRPDEVIGQVMDARLTPESAARVARDVDLRLRRIAAGDKTANVVVSELDQICKNGEVISTEIVSSYLLDADGVAHTILGITRNVSERKAAERALRETNRQLHARIEEIGRLQVALQELAVRDSLTGLYNRRYMDETLDREVSRARREGIPLSLVMLDIDYFKRVNDTYGHQVGDEALKMLASTLLADIRAEDVACRYGGEEFLILLPNMPLETAMMRAERWRQAVEELSVSLGNFSITFTISLGVAAYPEHGKTPDDLTRCADQALYRAKNDGRNRVTIFSA